MEALNLTKTPNPSLSKALFRESHLLRTTFKPQLIPCGVKTRSLHSSRNFSFTFTCKLKTPQDIKNEDKSISKKIVLSEVAPPLGEEGGEGTGNGKVPVKSGSGGGVMKLVKKFSRKVLAILSNLPLAIGEMSTVAGLMALGMLSKSSSSSSFYFIFYIFGNCVRLGYIHRG